MLSLAFDALVFLVLSDARRPCAPHVGRHGRQGLNSHQEQRGRLGPAPSRNVLHLRNDSSVANEALPPHLSFKVLRRPQFGPGLPPLNPRPQGGIQANTKAQSQPDASSIARMPVCNRYHTAACKAAMTLTSEMQASSSLRPSFFSFLAKPCRG